MRMSSFRNSRYQIAHARNLYSPPGLENRSRSMKAGDLTWEKAKRILFFYVLSGVSGKSLAICSRDGMILLVKSDNWWQSRLHESNQNLFLNSRQKLLGPNLSIGLTHSREILTICYGREFVRTGKRHGNSRNSKRQSSASS